MHGRPDKGAMARRGRTGLCQPEPVTLPPLLLAEPPRPVAGITASGESSWFRGSLERCSRLRASLDCSRSPAPTRSHQPASPARVSDRARPAGDLHRTRRDRHRGFPPDDLIDRCRQHEHPTVRSMLRCLRPRSPADSAEGASWAVRAANRGRLVVCPRSPPARLTRRLGPWMPQPVLDDGSSRSGAGPELLALDLT